MPALRLAETCEVEFPDAGNFGSPFSATPVGREGFLQGGGPWVFSCVGIRYEASEKFSGGGIEQMALLVEFGAFFFCNRFRVEGHRQQKGEQSEVAGSWSKTRA